MFYTMRLDSRLLAVPSGRRRAVLALDRLTDGELVYLTLNGQPDAYGELVRRYQARVYNIALRMVGDRQDALDLAQDCFVRAYDALRTFDRTRPFAPWINRMVTNLAL